MDEPVMYRLVDTSEYIKIVSSKEYENWLYNFLKTNRIADDEDALYLYKGKDAEYGVILSYYFTYLVRLHHDDLKETCTNGFYTEYYDFMLRDLPCRISTVFGQGANTFIQVMNNNLNSSDLSRGCENCFYNRGCYYLN